MAEIRSGDDIFFTKTMAEVLEAQGQYEDALMIYKILANTRQDSDTVAQVERLKTLAQRRARRGRVEP